MPGDYDVLLWGVYFCDLIFTDLPQVPRLGAEVFSTDFSMTPGGPFTTAVAMHRLGLRVGWMCDFGDDVFSQFVLAAAKHEGIEDGLFQLHPFPVRRVSAAFSFAHDRGFVSFMDDVAQTSPVPLIERHRPRCVFLPHLHYGAPSEWPSEGDGQVYADLFACARAQGAVIFMDCQSTDATLEAPGVVGRCKRSTFSPQTRSRPCSSPARRRSSRRSHAWLN